jgi:Mrp family chromosome partitioning ATPase
MDRIIQALELSKERRTPSAAISSLARARAPDLKPLPDRQRELRISDVEVSIVRLEEMRMVAHDPADRRSRCFDLLRTQVLQAMETNGWRILAITSPTAGCGKTFTAMNLALSVARQPGSSVLLVDMDLKKPQVAQRLGIQPTTGLRALLEDRSSVYDAITRISVAGLTFGVLPCERVSSRSSDWLSSAAMTSAFQQLRADGDYKVIILDLPPLLASDDVISVLPQVDAVVLVAAVGATRTAELKECANYLSSTPVLRVALNKVPDVPLDRYH